MTSVSGVNPQSAYLKTEVKEINQEELEKLQAQAEIAQQIEKAMSEDKVDNFEKEGADKKTKKKLDASKIAWVALVSLGGGAVAMKFMPVIRRLGTKVLGSLLEKSVKVAGKLGEKHPKLAFNTEKVLNKIASAKKELMEGNSTKIFEKVKSSLQEILGVEIKANSPVLAGIKNDVGFIDAGMATGFGFATAGRAAMHDDKEITKSDVAKEAGKIILIAG